jgi:hypothetical protein
MRLVALLNGSVFVAAVTAAIWVAGCDQDSYSSTAERDTHMGDARAATPPPPASVTTSAAMAAAPATPPATPAPAAASAPASSTSH